MDPTPHTRANLVWEPDAKRELLDRDWRADPVPYDVPDHLRLPTTHPPTTCTEALCRRIEQLVISGVSVRAAKTTCGVSRDNWRQWEGYAKHDQQPYWQMFERMRLAMAYRETTLSRTLGAAAEHPDPSVALKATDKLLSVTAPKLYAPQKAAPTQQNTTNVQINVGAVNALGTLDTTKLELLASALAGRVATAPIPAQSALSGPSSDEDEP